MLPRPTYVEIDLHPYRDTDWWHQRQHLLLLLTDRERAVVQQRHGIPSGSGAMLGEIGASLGVSRELVRKMLLKAQNKVADFEEFEIALLLELRGRPLLPMGCVQHLVENCALLVSGCAVSKLKAQVIDDQTIVEELNLKTRGYNYLKRKSISTVGDLLRKRESDLLAIRGFGQVSLNDVIDALDSHGLKLREE